MNFWTFLDRNGNGLGFLALIFACFAFGWCADDRGCRVRCVTVGAETGPNDAGPK